MPTRIVTTYPPAEAAEAGRDRGAGGAVAGEEVLNAPLSVLGLNVRALNALLNNGFRTVGDLVPMREAELMDLLNLGQHTLRDIKAKLSAQGLRLREAAPTSRRRRGAVKSAERAGRMGTPAKRQLSESAQRLLAYLRSLPDGATLPPMPELAKMLGFFGGGYDLHNAFQSLVAHQLIKQQHGTYKMHRGHRIVRIDGRVVKTEGCQLELP